MLILLADLYAFAAATCVFLAADRAGAEEQDGQREKGEKIKAKKIIKKSNRIKMEQLHRSRSSGTKTDNHKVKGRAAQATAA